MSLPLHSGSGRAAVSPPSEPHGSPLHSHHSRLSPPISPASYLSVITDLKTAQTLSVTAQARTPARRALAHPGAAKKKKEKKNHFLLQFKRNYMLSARAAFWDDYLAGMRRDPLPILRRICIQSFNPGLNGSGASRNMRPDTRRRCPG